MPTQSGPRDAVAVESAVADKLISAYTFMLDHIVLLVWSIVVIIVLLLCVRKYEETHPNTPLSQEIWHKRSSPYDILTIALKHLAKSESKRWFILLWLIMALAFVVVKYTIPIIFAPYIKLDSAAPVNASAVFVPSRNGSGNLNTADNTVNFQVYNFNVPAALRAIGSVESVLGTLNGNSSVSVDQPEIIGERADGELIMRIGYRYRVTGLDLGLQYYPDLVFNVEGSCMTEYGWLNTELRYNNSYCPSSILDIYDVFNIPNQNYGQPVSACDGPPRAFFYESQPSLLSSGNWTWAAIISSVGRTSFFQGTDPWYLTAANPFYTSNQNVTAPYMVLPKRPALSCWENDVWSYKGNNASILELDSIPGLSLSAGILTILTSYLSEPMIFTLGTYLQSSALRSSTTAVQNVINANSSSIFNDLQRLVFASYIATVNTLTKTTLYSPPNGFLNDVQPNGVLLDGTGDFVIYSNDIATLSVRSLIIIPTLAVALWIIFLTIMFMPIPKRALSTLAKSQAAEKPEPKTEDSQTEKGLGNVIQQVVTELTSNNSKTSLDAV